MGRAEMQTRTRVPLPSLEDAAAALPLLAQQAALLARGTMARGDRSREGYACLAKREETESEGAQVRGGMRKWQRKGKYGTGERSLRPD